jgi:hypothetical protein
MNILKKLFEVCVSVYFIVKKKYTQNFSINQTLK